MNLFDYAPLDNGTTLGLTAVITTIFAGVCTVIGAAGGFLLKLWHGTWQTASATKLAAAKQESEIELSQDKQALAIFQKLVESLMPRIEALEREIKELTRKESECRAQNAALEEKVKALTADNVALRGEMADLKGDLQIARAEHEET